MNQQFQRKIRGLGRVGLLLWLLVCAAPAVTLIAQTDPTPIPVSLPTRTPDVTSEPLLPTVTGTRAVPLLGPTNTLPSVVVEVRDQNVPGNVRQAPSVDAEIIGKIRPGSFYQVVSRSEKWLQIIYGTPSPDTLGWVYEDIVVVTGNLASVPKLGIGQVPTANVPTVQAQQTNTALAVSVGSTPGGFASATSARASATGVFLRTQVGPSLEPTLSGPMPTFTRPPPFAEATLAPRSSGLIQVGLPPIFPIIALAALGLFGLLISSFRRL